jgi:hypothetical protein
MLFCLRFSGTCSREKKTEKKGEEQAFCPGLQKEEEATNTKS